MKIYINVNKYNIKKRQVDTDSYDLIVTPKKRTCCVCKKGFDSVGNETLVWYDDEGFYRIGYFCKQHYIFVKKVLTEKKRKGYEI